jgi:flagellar biosynthetic protein FliR
MPAVASFAAALDALQGFAAATLLIATRLGALFLATPPFGAVAVPATVRFLLVLALAAALAPTVDARAALAAVAGPGALVAALASEAAFGAAMALGVALAFAAFQIGARLLDVQIGFGIGQVFDPSTQQQLPVLAGLAAPLALVLFVTADVHHALLRAVAAGLERFPPGTPWPLEAAAAPVFAQASAAFALGFALVAPVVLVLALVDLGLGVLGRNLPQMNLFVLGIPVKVVAGIAALSLWIAGAGPVVARVHATLLAGWADLVR